MLPVWAFNFRGDWVISSDAADDMCEQLQARGGKPKQTKFNGIGHDCWDKAVTESELVSWMLEQRVSARPVASVQPGISDVR